MTQYGSDGLTPREALRVVPQDPGAKRLRTPRSRHGWSQRMPSRLLGRILGIFVISASLRQSQATDLHRKFVEFFEAGKIACALCHGVAILRYAKLSNGQHLARGKTVTGFANVEEDFADNAAWEMNLLPRDKHIMPWRIEDEMKRIGANYIQAGLWRGFAVRDGNLITGQQNFSGTETANLLAETLGA